MSKQRNLRKRRALDELEDLEADQNEGEAPALTAEDIKLLQKERQRKTGVDAAAIAVAKKDEKQNTLVVPEGPADGLHAAFNKEKQQLADEDNPHMNKYIEQQLAQRLGRPVLADDDASHTHKPRSLDDAALDAVPYKKKALDTDGMGTWVAGVVEVPLDVKHRLRNIEATEAAKAALLSRGAPYPGRPSPYDARDDDDGDGARGGNQLRRSAFPVGFGHRPVNEEKRVQDAVAKKARMKALQEEKKRRKESEFAGW